MLKDKKYLLFETLNHRTTKKTFRREAARLSEEPLQPSAACAPRSLRLKRGVVQITHLFHDESLEVLLLQFVNDSSF